MSETKLDNKYVEVDGNGYRLTIVKEKGFHTTNSKYIAYLSSTETPFSANVTYRSSLDVQKHLKQWIIDMNGLNHSEELVFTRLEEWDGVIKV